ncbi:Rv1535 domain-containing protein [Mycobacterium sp. MFM001]|uniref:Rv1535 domain-containing protein n=1 Tax=Mycobacterium sp. MFM001 TaxID=2049453 RepID=UPI00352C67C2
MSTTDALADPLASALAVALTVPVIELYAVLWRAGVLEAVPADQTLGAGQTADGVRRLPRRLPPRLIPAPAPSRWAREVYSRAAG